LHYKKLIEAHKAFYKGEHRAKNYDRYMLEQKNWKKWENPILPVDEIEKLFRFIRSWDRFFRGDSEVFKEIYEEINPIIKELKHERIEDVDFNEKLKATIRDVFDKVGDCTLIGRYESTDASKILHTILPKFFVMWDDNIKNWMVQGRNDGATYAFDFLPKVQGELAEAIETCMSERQLNREEAIKYIRQKTGWQTLAKLADEYNYTKYTIGYPSL